jgi:hypothetical protein
MRCKRYRNACLVSINSGVPMLLAAHFGGDESSHQLCWKVELIGQFVTAEVVGGEEKVRVKLGGSGLSGAILKEIFLKQRDETSRHHPTNRNPNESGRIA